MEFTPVYVSLAQGVKSSIADDAVNPGSGSLVLENFVIEQREELVPRDGDVSLSNLDVHGGYITTPWRLATRGPAPSSLTKYGNPSPLYSYSPTRSRWAPVSSTINGPTSYSLSAVAGGKIQTHAKAYLPGYVAIATYDTIVGDAEAIIIDETTGQTLFAFVWTSASGTIGRVRVVACKRFVLANYDNEGEAAHQGSYFLAGVPGLGDSPHDGHAPSRFRRRPRGWDPVQQPPPGRRPQPSRQRSGRVDAHRRGSD